VCSWQSDWNLPQLQSSVYGRIVDWAIPPYNGQTSTLRPIRLPTSPYKIAVARGSNETQRCPSWDLCEGSTKIGPHSAILLPYDGNWTLLPSNATVFGYDSRLPCTRDGLSEACKAFLCGQPAVAHRGDNSPVDWWVCAGDNCGAGGGGWQQACQDSSTCVITMSDQDVYVVSVPVTLRNEINADGINIDLDWCVVNAGL